MKKLGPFPIRAMVDGQRSPLDANWREAFSAQLGRRQRRDGPRATAAGRVPDARLQTGALDAGRLASVDFGDGDGARPHRRLERSRADAIARIARAA